MASTAFGAITDDIARLETGFSQTSLDLVSVVGRLYENLKLVDASAKQLTTSSQTTVDSMGKLDKRIATLEDAPKVDQAMLTRLGDMEKNIAEEANAIRENTLRDIAEGEKVKSLETSVNSLAEQNRRLEGSLLELKNTVTSLVTTNSKLEGRVESLEEALEAANARNHKLEGTVESHWKQNTDQHGAHVQKFTSQEAEKEASDALHFERLSNYRASEWEKALTYELGKVEVTDSGAAELEILSSAMECRLGAQAMYGVDFGEANDQALKSVVVSPTAADVLSLCGVLYIEVSSDSTRACAVGEHAVLGQIADNQLMTFPGTSMFADEDSAAGLGMIGTKDMQDSAESVNALAGAVAGWMSKASVSKIVLHGAIGRDAAYSQEEKLVRLASGTGEPLNNVERLAAAIIEKSSQQDMQVWLWPCGPSCPLQLKNDWKSLSRGLVINMSSDKVAGALDGQPVQYENAEHEQFSSQSVLTMRSREEIWRTAKTVVDRLGEVASKRPFKLVLTGAVSARLQKAAAMLDGEPDGGTDKYLHLFERVRELENLSIPGVDALEQGAIGELQSRLEANEIRIGEVDDAVRAQVPTLEALTDASRIDAIVDSKLEGLDIWVQIRSSMEDMALRLEREVVEGHDTAEKVGRLNTTVKDMVGSAGRWVDSEHLETVITSLRRDVKDMQDRGHQVVVDAMEELARNKADRKELYKALKDPSAVGMRRGGSDPNFKREILDGLGARLHGRNGEEPNSNGLLTAGRFEDGGSPSPQRMRPKSAGPATHRVRRRLPDPYEVEEGTPKVIRTGPIPAKPSPTKRREVRTVVAPGGGGSSNSALLKSASSPATAMRPVNGRPGQGQPESSGSFEVNVPRIGQTLSSTPVALAAMEEQ